MALVQGEDSESDEEINTDQLGEGSLGYAAGGGTNLESHKAGIVPGEESETDDEDAPATPGAEQTDSVPHLLPVPPRDSPRGSVSPRRTSLESSPIPAPAS